MHSRKIRNTILVLYCAMLLYVSKGFLLKILDSAHNLYFYDLYVFQKNGFFPIAINLLV